MAALHVIKDRVRKAQPLGDDDVATLHRRLVEDALCGLDINRHAVQLAACNLTLGAPTVDYRRLNLLTLRNGPQEDDDVRSGSLEILATVDVELLPLRDAEQCPVRRAIDEAAAFVLNVSPEKVADWRRRLSAEPTITNRRAARG